VLLHVSTLGAEIAKLSTKNTGHLTSGEGG
jgi:hypothetical protein